MEVVVTPDVGAGAALVVDAIATLVARQPDAVLGLATGSSPEPLYLELARRSRNGTLDLSQVRAFLLDEYVGLPTGHPSSYRTVIEQQVVGPLKMASDQVLGPDGHADDILAACAAYEQAICGAGGVDLQVLDGMWWLAAKAAASPPSVTASLPAAGAAGLAERAGLAAATPAKPVPSTSSNPAPSAATVFPPRASFPVRLPHIATLP